MQEGFPQTLRVRGSGWRRPGAVADPTVSERPALNGRTPEATSVVPKRPQATGSTPHGPLATDTVTRREENPWMWEATRPIRGAVEQQKHISLSEIASDLGPARSATDNP